MNAADHQQCSLFGSRPRRQQKPLGFARALAIVVARGKQLAEHAEAPREAGSPDVRARKCCPRCGHRGEVSRDFGYRVIRGERRPQSWCRDCRAGLAPPPPQLELLAS